jgi:hypothetical protein
MEVNTAAERSGSVYTQQSIVTVNLTRQLQLRGELAMYLHELYQKERYKDFVREAEQDRKKKAERAGRKPFYKPALKRVGAKLVEVGNRLQDNVETVTPVQMVTTPESV